jgi:hypothetical protein
MIPIRIPSSFPLLILLLLSCCCMVGCQFAPKKLPDSWKWGADDKPALPDRILAVWTDTVLHQPNQPGVRGFGGRVFFYLKDQTDPIEVDGKLAVYVFDAEDADPMNQKPLRKYVFTADQFASHMSKTSIGPSYSVWLPWGEVGGPQMKLSIIARFEGVDGGTTISDPTIKLLPGIVSRNSDGETFESGKLGTGKLANDKNGSEKSLTGGGVKFRLSNRTTKETIEDSDDGVQLASGIADGDDQGVQRASYLKKSSSTMKSSAGRQESLTRGFNDSREIKPEDSRSVQTIDLPPAFERHFQESSVVNTEVIDMRSGNVKAFQKGYSRSDSGVSQEGSGSAVKDSSSKTPAMKSSEPRVLRRNSANRLEVLRSGKWIDSIHRRDGNNADPVLNGVELHSMDRPQGSLSDNEPKS